MSEKENIQSAQALFDHFNARNMQAIDAQHAPGHATAFAPGAAGPLNEEQNWMVLQGFWAAFPDIKLEITLQVAVQFQQHTGPEVRGRLTAVGTTAEPITFTGRFPDGGPSRGWWDGIWIQGTAQVPSLGSELSQATVEYAGYGGGPSAYTGYGSAGISDSIVREGGSTGIAVGVVGSGTAIIESQVVANAGKGITVVGSYGLSTRRVSIRGSSIYGNGGLGIDLDDDGVTANDPGDGDGGTNDGMNLPTLSATYDGSQTTISGTLDTASPASATVDLFTCQTPDPSGQGPGQQMLGWATPDAGGAFRLTLDGPLPFAFVSATATNAGGSTSEFSATVTVSGGARHLVYLPLVARNP